MGFLTQDPPIASSVVTEDSTTQSAFLSKVYGLLLVGLVAAAAGAFVTMTNPTAQALVLGHPILMIVVYFGLFFGCRALRRTPGINILALLAFTLASGAFLAPAILVAAFKTGSLAVVFEAATITGSIFVGLTLYTLISKKDFSFMGGFLTVGLWSILGLMLIIMVLSFFHVDVQAASLAIAWLGSGLFSLFILYNTSAIMRSSQSDEYVAAALMLFLNVINLFLFILQILSSGRRN
ncbi:MAG: Bax inhibitor-1 family protein [bacterium]